MDSGFSTAAFSCQANNATNPAPSRLRGWWTSSRTETIESAEEEDSLSYPESRPSRRPSRSYGYTLSDAATEDMAAGHTPFEILVDTLQRAGLPGPAIFIADREKLGERGQFQVFKQRVVSSEREGFSSDVVAIKTPKFPYDYDTKLDLARNDVRKHLNHVYNEIKALTAESLRHHPNIVKLLSWSRESYQWQSPLALVLELAFSNLSEFLSSRTDFPEDLKVSLSLDVASGLEAIHRCHIIHGDLKPPNVLMFGSTTGPIAKLADFGFSTEDEAEIHGGTLDWQAPELRSASPSTSVDLCKTDRFSYGLMLWSVFFHSGHLPESSQGNNSLSLAMKDLEKNKECFDVQLVSALEKDLVSLLQISPRDRPESLVGLSMFTVEKAFFDSMESPEDYIPDSDEERFSEESDDYLPKYTWEMYPLSTLLADDLFNRFMQNQAESNSMAPHALFSMYLVFTAEPPGDYSHATSTLAVLEAAAKKGHHGAKASVFRAFDYFEVPPTTDMNENAIGWLREGVLSGSTVARLDLKRLDTSEFRTCMEFFHDIGGYNHLYWPNAAELPRRGPDQDPGTDTSCLHVLAAFGSLSELEEYLEAHPEENVDHVSTLLGTPLYLACARGCLGIVTKLLACGADPSIRCTPFGITCLHWVLAFDDDVQPRIVEVLVEAGADINALSSTEVPFPHYPFALPRGTPLHWAVSTSSYSAVSSLVDQGADISIRDGSDPYTYDERVRVLNKFGGPNQEPFSFSEAGCEGLTPLDIAATERDHIIFQLILRKGIAVDINMADEEGFNVLHRLSSSPVRRTSQGTTFSALPFRPMNGPDSLRATVVAILDLGGNIEAQTTPAVMQAQGLLEAASVDFTRRTPLMLAVGQKDVELVEILLDCGANADTENEAEQTALLCLGDVDDDEDEQRYLKCVQILLAHGANVNHRSVRGDSVALITATLRYVSVLRFLFSAGADIDEREPSDTSASLNANLFSFLNNDERADIEEHDVRVSKLLEDFVFSCEDPIKKRRVVEVGDQDGCTLLHKFASRSMPRTVETLLRHGAPVNPLHLQYEKTREGDINYKRAWYETPLDMVLDYSSRRDRDMRRDSRWSPSEFRELKKRDERVIQILQSYGGITIPKDGVIKKPFLSDAECELVVGPGKLRTVLRNY